jgi:hypothetical protein
MSRTNAVRVRDAGHCLKLLASLSGTDTDRALVTDLIANLGHYCDCNQLDFAEAIQSAQNNWQAERDLPPKTYRVRIAESLAYDLEVEAPNEETAEVVAQERFRAMTDQERNARFALTRGDLDILEMEEV